MEDYEGPIFTPKGNTPLPKRGITDPMPANPARHNSMVLKLAAMDWARIPTKVISEELKIGKNHLNLWRQDPVYKQTVLDLTEEFREKLLKNPHTNEVAKRIAYALDLAVTKVIHILASSRTSNRDVIGAARLIAQMDGRFLGNEKPDAAHDRPDTDSLATELIQAINRSKPSVQ